MTHTQLLTIALTKVAGRPQPAMWANADTINPAVPSPVTDAIRQNQASMSQSYAAEPEATPAPAVDPDADVANEWFEDNDNQEAVNDGIRGTQTPAAPVPTPTPQAPQDNVWASRLFGFGEGLGQGAKNLAGAFKPLVAGVTDSQQMFGR